MASPVAVLISLKVLDYCGRAHLQAVLDEYVYLQIGNVNGDEAKSAAEKLVEQIGVVFSMHAGSPHVNNRVGNKLQTDSTTTGSAHFALAFGDDSQVESENFGDYAYRRAASCVDLHVLQGSVHPPKARPD